MTKRCSVAVRASTRLVVDEGQASRVTIRHAPSPVQTTIQMTITTTTIGVDSAGSWASPPPPRTRPKTIGRPAGSMCTIARPTMARWTLIRCGIPTHEYSGVRTISQTISNTTGTARCPISGERNVEA